MPTEKEIIKKRGWFGNGHRSEDATGEQQGLISGKEKMQKQKKKTQTVFPQKSPKSF